MPQNSDIKIILFDLGGVLVEFSGIDKIIEWTGEQYTRDKLKKKWLSSLSVRRFESGKTTPIEFSKSLIEEFNLPVTPEQFLDEFRLWVQKKMINVDELLTTLSKTYHLACFSNTNAIHWPIIQNNLGIGHLLHEHYLSFETGLLKPDDAAFQFVIKKSSCPPESILFFDDSLINITSAKKHGIHAYCVSSIDEIRTILNKLTLL